MPGHAFQVEGLQAAFGQARQNPGLARSGIAVEQHEVQRPGLVVQPRLHMPPIGPVPADQQAGPPAHPREDRAPFWDSHRVPGLRAKLPVGQPSGT